MWGVPQGAEGALGSGVRVLAVGLEGADREQLRRMVTGEDPRYIYGGGRAEGELTDDLCTIISTRVRGWGLESWGVGAAPWGPGSSPPTLRFTWASLVLPAGAGAKAEALYCAVPQGEHPHAVLCHRGSELIVLCED